MRFNNQSWAAKGGRRSLFGERGKKKTKDEVASSRLVLLPSRLSPLALRLQVIAGGVVIFSFFFCLPCVRVLCVSVCGRAPGSAAVLGLGGGGTNHAKMQVTE